MAKHKKAVAGSDVNAPEAENSVVNPDEGSIAALAYHLWMARGCPIGSDQDDWFQAESILRQHRVEEPAVSEQGPSRE